MVTFNFNGHRFDINWSNWTGKEVILYDGRVASEKRDLFILKSTHRFSAVENDEEVQYEVVINPNEIPFDVEVRRGGVLIYCRNKGGLTGQGLVARPASVKPPESRETIIRETIVREVVLVVCPNCSHRNDSSKRICEKCGASL